MARGSQNAFGILQARPGPRLRAGLESGFIDQPGMARCPRSTAPGPGALKAIKPGLEMVFHTGP